MTKEKLYKEIVGGMDVSYAHKKALDEFFNSNVCIPKGATLQYCNITGEYNDIFNLTDDISKYRIKPHDPVYEWQCHTVSMSGAELIGWFTDNEIDITKPQMYKLEETKRVRRSE